MGVFTHPKKRELRAASEISSDLAAEKELIDLKAVLQPGWYQ